MRGVVVVLSLLLVSACNQQSAETRAREAEQKIREAIPDVVGRALEQKVTPEQVTHAQQALTTLKEYMGEVNGVLDPVTVNAIQAFQRSQGLEANGLLTDKTQRRLEEAAAQATRPQS